MAPQIKPLRRHYNRVSLFFCQGAEAEEDHTACACRKKEITMGPLPCQDNMKEAGVALQRADWLQGPPTGRAVTGS